MPGRRGTGGGIQFANPKRAGARPGQHARERGAAPGTSLSLVIPAGAVPGAYQVRVIRLTAAGSPAGEAVTIVVQ